MWHPLGVFQKSGVGILKILIFRHFLAVFVSFLCENRKIWLKMLIFLHKSMGQLWANYTELARLKMDVASGFSLGGAEIWHKKTQLLMRNRIMTRKGFYYGKHLVVQCIVFNETHDLIKETYWRGKMPNQNIFWPKSQSPHQAKLQ